MMLICYFLFFKIYLLFFIFTLDPKRANLAIYDRIDDFLVSAYTKEVPHSNLYNYIGTNSLRNKKSYYFLRLLSECFRELAFFIILE